MRSVFCIGPEVARSSPRRQTRRSAPASGSARGFVEEPVVHGADRAAVVGVVGAERRYGLGVVALVAQTPRHTEERLGIDIQRLDRLIALDAQPALERAQEVVAL